MKKTVFAILIFVLAEFILTSGDVKKINKKQSITVMRIKSPEENDQKALLARDLMEEALIGRGIYVVEYIHKKNFIDILTSRGKVADSITLAQFQLTGTLMGKSLRGKCRSVQGSDYIGAFSLKMKSWKKTLNTIKDKLDNFTPEIEKKPLIPKNNTIVLIPECVCENIVKALKNAVKSLGFQLVNKSDKITEITHAVILSKYMMDDEIHITWRMVDISNRRIKNVWHLFDIKVNESLSEEMVDVMK